MTVVKVFYETHEDLLITVATEFYDKNEKTNFEELERRKKIIRCYSCGHISATCALYEICENCGEGLSAKTSSNSPRFFNCGGYHKASSNQCQTDLTKL